MSEQFHNNVLNFDRTSNVIPFPSLKSTEFVEDFEEKIQTPIHDKIVAEAKKLDELSTYKSDFNYEVYRSLETRFHKEKIRGGIVCKTDLKLVNFHPSCFKCHYTLELDTYGRGCIHECAYCYAKDELSLHGYWNNPIPFPIDVTEIRKIFYQVFETSRPSKWREILSKKVPIRIGSMSDSFMWSDLKYGVTLEVLKILNFYNYPYIIFTRSDLVAHDEYIKHLNPANSSVQFSICSSDDKLTKVFEPGAPSLKRRFAALKKIGESGIRTAVRINPLFPTYPDGYFTDRDTLVKRFGSEDKIPKLNFFDITNSEEFISQLSDAKVSTVLTGFVRLKSSSINLIKKQTGVDLIPFFKLEVISTGLRGNREKKFSDTEIAYYYKTLHSHTKKHGLNFTTCYIGNGPKDYYQYQSLWDNKSDCCDVKGNVSGFKSSSQDIPWNIRAKFSPNKDIVESGKQLEKQIDEQFTNL